MNILLINHYAGAPKYGMEFRPYYLAKEWIKLGHNVLIVGASYSHLRKNQPQAGTEIIDGISYLWIKTNRYKKNGIGRIISMFMFVFKIFFIHNDWFKKFEPDIVIASSTYPLDIFPAKKISKRYGSRLVFEIHDLWPMSPMSLGGYSKHHPFIMVMQFAENFAYKNCDKCISILPNVHDHVYSHGLSPSKLGLVPNGYDANEWRDPLSLSEDLTAFFDKLKFEGKTILGYTGGHAISNTLDQLLEAMIFVNDISDEIVCVLVGNGVEKKNLIEYTNEKQIRNVYFLESIPKSMIPSLLARMDLLYLGGKDHPLYRFGTSQTKLFDYFQAAKPVIQTISPPNNYVEESGSGVTVLDNTPRGISNSIIKLLNTSDDELNKMGLRGKEYCSSHFNYKKLAFHFLKFAIDE